MKTLPTSSLNPGANALTHTQANVKSYEIADASGRVLVKSNTLSAAQARRIDISGLGSGVYFLQTHANGRCGL